MLELDIGFSVDAELVLLEVVLLIDRIHVFLTVFVKSVILSVRRPPRPPLVASFTGLRGGLFDRLFQVKHIVEVVGCEALMHAYDFLALGVARGTVFVVFCRIHGVDVFVALVCDALVSVMRVEAGVHGGAESGLHLGWVALWHASCQLLFRSGRAFSD